MNPLQVFRDEIAKEIRAAIKTDTEFPIDEPPEGLGDFCVKCFQFAKQFRRSPVEISMDLETRFSNNPLFEKVEAKGGYLNFYVNRREMARIVLGTVLEEREKYGNGSKKGRIIVEHTSANPTGPLHVGRGRNPIIGDTLARVLRALGYEVQTEYYVDDMGRQLAILAWAYKNLGIDGEEKKGKKEDHVLVELYRKGNELFENEEKIRREIEAIIRQIEQGNREIIAYQRKIAEKCMKGIVATLERCNIHIDNFVYESEFLLDGSVYEVVERLKQSRHAGCEDGAYYIDLAPFGFHGKDSKFFFTRGDGTSLYTTRDIAYHLNKFSRCDVAINVLGEDHKLQAKMVAISLQELGVERKPEILFYSFVSLPEGKMSTRAGRVVYLDDLVEEAVAKAKEEILKRGRESKVDVDKVSVAVGIGAIRFNIVKIQPEKQIVFRWEEALNFEGNSAPFVQYAHARAASILRNGNVDIRKITYNAEHLRTPEEDALIKVLAKFPDVVDTAGEERKVYLIPQYLHKLAETFNTFYRYVPVLNAGEERETRIALVYATKCTLANGLQMLGIEALEEM
ncbi:MAG: arginine--tRNA ligase [Thermoplasmata archaeon]|nr:arginine--tRNA ligase [Thermoplasmata archaeon]